MIIKPIQAAIAGSGLFVAYLGRERLNPATGAEITPYRRIIGILGPHAPVSL
jgi:hypothetical protein